MLRNTSRAMVRMVPNRVVQQPRSFHPTTSTRPEVGQYRTDELVSKSKDQASSTGSSKSHADSTSLRQPPTLTKSPHNTGHWIKLGKKQPVSKLGKEDLDL